MKLVYEDLFILSSTFLRGVAFFWSRLKSSFFARGGQRVLMRFKTPP